MEALVTILVITNLITVTLFVRNYRELDDLRKERDVWIEADEENQRLRQKLGEK
jgi:hypothetical protein